MNESMWQALLPVVLVGIVAILVFEAWHAQYLRSHVRCICGHTLKDHVSALDWDSFYGDPQAAGPDFKKPGSCRKCHCRHFITGRVPAEVPIRRQ